MKALYIREHGDPGVLTYGDLPEPEIGPNEIKVRVRACAINRVDVFTRLGVRGTRLGLDQPHILGGDAAGDVVEIGHEVTRIRVKDRVVINPKLTCNQCQFCIAGQDELCTSPSMLGSTTNGSYAELVKAPAINAVRLPDCLSYDQAAALPTVFMPSWNILVRRAQLRPSETALILSASSGVGTAAIQIAKKVSGARVIATTSTKEKADKARALGADEVIDYSLEDIEKRVRALTDGRGVDVVLDHVGADFWPAASRSLAPGGRYGICGVTTGYKSELQMGLLFLRNQTVFGVFMGRKDDLRQIVDLAGKGVIRSVIHDAFPLSDAAVAHELLESQGFFGKLILNP